MVQKLDWHKIHSLELICAFFNTKGSIARRFSECLNKLKVHEWFLQVFLEIVTIKEEKDCLKPY